MTTEQRTEQQRADSRQRSSRRRSAMHGVPCAECGAPLAEDQRYCLNCGQRRADARLPFLEVLETRFRPSANRKRPEQPAVQASKSRVAGGDGELGGRRGVRRRASRSAS